MSFGSAHPVTPVQFRGAASPEAEPDGTKRQETNDMSLSHPAEEFATRLKNGNIDAAVGMSGKLNRGALKWAILEIAGDDLEWDEEKVNNEVFGDGSASVTKTELVALAAFIGENCGDGDGE